MPNNSIEDYTAEVWKLIEEIRGGKKKLDLGGRELRILVEVVKEAEEFKPSQHAKRIVFAKHGILGTELDRLLTAIFYEIMKRLGVIDKIAAEIAGVKTILILDPWLRAALRTAVALILFHKQSKKMLHNMKWTIADYLSAKTHPYVGMFYWEIFDKITEYKPRVTSYSEYLEYKYSLPSWFIDKMIRMLGREEAEQLFKALNEKPLISVRVNTLKATVDEIVEELKKEGKNPIVSSRVPTIVKFKGPYDFDKSRLYREGKIIIQEEAAAAAALILNPQPGETVVDLCAAPGGKTIHIAELMRLRGRIYAFDIDEARLKRMKMLLKRTGTSKIVKIIKADARKADKILGNEIADRVLLDAPCSSTGTIAKNPELRWRIHPEKIDELVFVQRGLLVAGFRLLKPGGLLLYTTCSLLVEENEDNIRWFLGEYQGRAEIIPLQTPYEESKILKGAMRAWPHKHKTIGFYYTLIRKKK